MAGQGQDNPGVWPPCVDISRPIQSPSLPEPNIQTEPQGSLSTSEDSENPYILRKAGPPTTLPLRTRPPNEQPHLHPMWLCSAQSFHISGKGALSSQTPTGSKTPLSGHEPRPGLLPPPCHCSQENRKCLSHPLSPGLWLSGPEFWSQGRTSRERVGLIEAKPVCGAHMSSASLQLVRP